MYTSNKGFFISFEGVDGCGKSTQIKLISEYLVSQDIITKIVREPGGTDFSEKIRNILLDNDSNIGYNEETLLFLTARSNLVNKFIKPKLDAGLVVLCDRFMDSTLAYQGYGRGICKKLINDMNRFAVGDCLPSLTILFDADPVLLLERNSNKKLDRMEIEGLDFQNKVRNGYLDIARNNSRFYIVDCNDREIEDIHYEVKDLFMKTIIEVK